MTGIEMELSGLPEGVEEIKDKLIDYCLLYMYNKAYRAAPKASPPPESMASRIYWKKEGDGGKVVSPAPYTGYVEYGTENKYGTPIIVVGTPKNPRKRWKALEERGAVGSGQSMPFMRPAIYALEAHLNSLEDSEWKAKLK